MRVALAHGNAEAAHCTVPTNYSEQIGEKG